MANIKILWRGSVFLMIGFISFNATAQWAVYDDRVHRQLNRINSIGGGQQHTNVNGAFANTRAENGDITWGTGNSQAVLRSLEAPFHEMEISEEEQRRFIGTVQDCGDQTLNPQHHNACLGLRNLRLQTLMQSQQLLRTLNERRTQIVNLIRAAQQLGGGGSGGSASPGAGGVGIGGIGGVGGGSNNEPGAGQLQRYQFELQAQQALLQADGLQLKILMEGYRQREKTYELQMAEARRVTDAGRTGTNGQRPRAVPFPVGAGAIPIFMGGLP